ncbi:VOC family protein [Micromonospora sp. NPDC047793]|uniref:VOC family protein n=1 Tax=unclassified Micromonospora TaxID=2617518 RepID=UPI001F44A598|nr:VOC family protein [Verrucosispora sp. SN26_14.1]
MTGPGAVPPVRQLRLVVEAEDYEAAVRFYRDVLGLPEQAAYSGGDGAEVVILDAGRATLEIANPAQKRMIDDVEVGRQVAPRIRVAFEVDDARATTDRLVDGGAAEVAPPTRTPWQSVNARLDAPADLHITVFEELRTLDERAALDGFGTDGGPAPVADGPPPTH